ncbi:MAG: hypothetical protein ARM1_0747 [Candidatus Micrarchaeota archaeon]|nr:MAG: hypothetical protein ARM1_0747 [Candidatus Micrarchaeota archaeon]
MQDQSQRHIFNIAIVSISIGLILLIISAVYGVIAVYITIKNGIHTVEDVYLTTFNIVFRIIIPFIAGFMLIYNGRLLLNIFRVSYSSKSEDKINSSIESIAKRFTDKEEYLLLRYIINSNGMTQKGLAQITGLNKVKVHRLIKRLLSKGIIKEYKDGIYKKYVINESIKDDLLGSR